ncbi:MAG: RluA family pseudouridine synthase [Patescibacteria group bacterium]
MKIDILHEDPNYIIINKPAGLMVHGDGRSKGETLVDWIKKNRPEIAEANVGEPIELASEGGDEDGGEAGEKIARVERPGIVHRLDRDTSGAMVIAKTPEAFAALKEQFQNREVKKTYHAVVEGNLKEDDGIIDRPIGRSARDFRRRVSGRGAKGELLEAITRWHVMKRGKLGDVDATLVEAIPKTGRTHQIRVHFKAIHHPIVGDAMYNPRFSAAHIARVALHSYSIAFTGLNGKKISAIAAYPDDFAALVAALSG